MARGDLGRIFAALHEARVRYLVVSGVAVVLHGHARFTADLDLILALDPPNVLAAVKALGSLGYRPRAPVDAAQLADPTARREWIEKKGMRVFSLWSPQLPATEIDLFVEEPFPFKEGFGRAVQADLGGIQVPVAAIQDISGFGRYQKKPAKPATTAKRAEDGWKSHESEQREAWKKLTYQQRLDWLEQAKEFAREAVKSAAARRAR